MVITIENKRRSESSLHHKYPDALIIDVTSKGKEPFLKLSPFYPHGDIPVPFSKGAVAASVEGIWQGLKVFENFDIDTSVFQVNTMKGLKRTVRKYGKPLGHRKGITGSELLNYIEARKLIYLPTYLWVLQNKVPDIINFLREESRNKNIVLLDYGTNGDVNNISSPLSHACLVKFFLENRYPS